MTVQVYRQYSIALTDKSSGKFLRAIAVTGATIKAGWTLFGGRRTSDGAGIVATGSMFFSIRFLSQSAVDRFESIVGYPLDLPKKE